MRNGLNPPRQQNPLTAVPTPPPACPGPGPGATPFTLGCSWGAFRFWGRPPARRAPTANISGATNHRRLTPKATFHFHGSKSRISVSHGAGVRRGFAVLPAPGSASSQPGDLDPVTCSSEASGPSWVRRNCVQTCSCPPCWRL